ncbi:hypothetical protein EDC04DRAFT_2614271 [Pisolithus marmoratus]|nr:hypothetical protein EDC04DRAFT_2614271 [Pisolithus marmoratus]
MFGPHVIRSLEVTWNVFVKRLWVMMGKVYEVARVEMYKAGMLGIFEQQWGRKLLWTSMVSLHHIVLISGYRLWVIQQFAAEADQLLVPDAGCTSAIVLHDEFCGLDLAGPGEEVWKGYIACSAALVPGFSNCSLMKEMPSQLQSSVALTTSAMALLASVVKGKAKFCKEVHWALRNVGDKVIITVPHLPDSSPDLGTWLDHLQHSDYMIDILPDRTPNFWDGEATWRCWIDVKTEEGEEVATTVYEEELRGSGWRAAVGVEGVSESSGAGGGWVDAGVKVVKTMCSCHQSEAQGMQSGGICHGWQKGWHMAGKWPLAKQVLEDEGYILVQGTSMILTGHAVPSDLCMGIQVQGGSTWQGIVSIVNRAHPVYQFTSDDWGEVNNLLGNQRTVLSTTSISRIWTPGKICLKMRCTMPSDEKSVLYGYPQSTTAIGVNCTKSTHCFQQKGIWNSDVFPPMSTGWVLTLMWILVDMMHLSSHLAWFLFSLPFTLQLKWPTTFKPDYCAQTTLGSSQPYLKLSIWYTHNAVICGGRMLVRPPVGLRQWNLFIGWMLEEGIVDGLELPPAYVHN